MEDDLISLFRLYNKQKVKYCIWNLGLKIQVKKIDVRIIYIKVEEVGDMNEFNQKECIE